MLDLGLIPDSVLVSEFAYYTSPGVLRPFGPPLDDRFIFTLVEYIAGLIGVAGGLERRTGDSAARVALTDALWNFANATQPRVPMTDWYNAQTAEQWGFQGRATVGEAYALALVLQRRFGGV